MPDTIRTLACHGDAIVVRHPNVGSAPLAAKYSPIPIIGINMLELEDGITPITHKLLKQVQLEHVNRVDQLTQPLIQ